MDVSEMMVYFSITPVKKKQTNKQNKNKNKKPRAPQLKLILTL